MGRRQATYAKVNPSDPSAWGQCDLCGFFYQLRELKPQQIWSGQSLYTFNSLRCWKCWDVPQPQLKTIILPPDPPPIVNSRVPNFAYEEFTVLIAQYNNTGPQPATGLPPWGSGPQLILCDQSGEIPLIMQYLTSDGQAPQPTPPTPPTPSPTFLTTEAGVPLTTDTGEPLTP